MKTTLTLSIAALVLCAGTTGCRSNLYKSRRGHAVASKTASARSANSRSVAAKKSRRKISSAKTSLVGRRHRNPPKAKTAAATKPVAHKTVAAHGAGRRSLFRFGGQKKKNTLYVDPPYPGYVMNGPVMQPSQRGTRYMETIYAPPETKVHSASVIVSQNSTKKSAATVKAASGIDGENDEFKAAMNEALADAMGAATAELNQWPHATSPSVPMESAVAKTTSQPAKTATTTDEVNPFADVAESAANVAAELTERPVFVTQQTATGVPTEEVVPQTKSTSIPVQTVSQTKQVETPEEKPATKPTSAMKVTWPELEPEEDFPLPVINPRTP